MSIQKMYNPSSNKGRCSFQCLVTRCLFMGSLYLLRLHLALKTDCLTTLYHLNLGNGGTQPLLVLHLHGGMTSW